MYENFSVMALKAYALISFASMSGKNGSHDLKKLLKCNVMMVWHLWLPYEAHILHILKKVNNRGAFNVEKGMRKIQLKSFVERFFVIKEPTFLIYDGVQLIWFQLYQMVFFVHINYN